MRLINTETLRPEQWLGRACPPYAILSHTWGQDEIFLQDLSTTSATNKAGWAKIRGACRVARENGFSYLWADTVCIDRASSAEINESINSMFRYYEQSGLCIVYLADQAKADAQDVHLFAHCRWFTRGWTLTELIAPKTLHFYSRDWDFVGTRADFANQIYNVSGVDPFVLAGGDFRKVPVARRLFWAARRETTQAEDVAYCLMGLFDINMPIIYGEGGKAAFERLQAQILTNVGDLSMFAWQQGVDWRSLTWALHESNLTWQSRLKLRNYLAKSPRDFESCGLLFSALGVQEAGDSYDEEEDMSAWETMSTTSTLVQSATDGPASVSIGQAVSFLVEDPELFQLFHVAMARSGIGVDRFRRILVGILRSLAMELAEEAEDKDQESSAKFVRRYRLVIGSAVAARVAEKRLEPVQLDDLDKVRTVQPEQTEMRVNETLHQCDYEPNVEHEAEDDGEEYKAEDEPETDPTITFDAISDFIRASKAFDRMRMRLKDLLYPSFRSKAMEVAERFVRADQGKYWATMRSRMFWVISELQYSTPSVLLFDSHSRLSVLEKMQLNVEDATKEGWNWWPLRRPRPKVKPGEARLGWTCRCGDDRWETVPEEFAQRLVSLSLKYPIADAVPHIQPPAPARNLARTSMTSRGEGAGSPHNFHRPFSGKVGHSPPGVMTTAPTSAPGLPHTPQARFIFLVTKFGRYSLDELPSLHLDTAEFSAELRAAYFRRKGFWRSLFSPYSFSHCDFVKFERFRRDAYAHRGYGLPDLRLQQYYYSPTSWEPPISPEEFKDLFQHATTRSRPKWTTVLPLHKTDDGDFPSDTVDRIPQRFWNFDKRASQREDFWGIYVREKRSAVMMALYMVLSVLPFVGFCLLYTFGVVRGDVQNAATPLALSLTMLAGLLGAIVKR